MGLLQFIFKLLKGGNAKGKDVEIILSIFILHIHTSHEKSYS